jgi:type II secretory pathway pseudopilin PulG
MSVRRRVAGEEGETLLEVIMAIAILGTAVVAIMAGVALSIRVSDIHRKQVSASAYVRSAAETIENAIRSDGSGYVACPTAPAYAASLSAAPSGFASPQVSVVYWNPATSTFGACPSGGDSGVQRVTISIASSDGRASEHLDVVIRKPCAAGSSCT